MPQCLLTGATCYLVKHHSVYYLELKSVDITDHVIPVAINNVTNYSHHSRVVTIKSVATIQGWLLLKVWLLFKGGYY